MKNLNKNNGITLISLVVTIIILIILAGISINLVLKENGLMEKSKYGKEQYIIEAIREKLDIIKGVDYIEKIGNSTIDTYLETLDKEKIEPYNVTNKEKVSDSVAIVEANNKYSYIIKIEGDGNIKIEYEGKVEEIDRTESLIEINISGDNIQSKLPIKLTAIVTSNGESINQPIWTLNTSGENFGTDEKKYNKAENENIDIEIGEVNTYYLHVLTTDDYGRKKETIKGPITIEEKYHKHTGSSTTGGGCYTKTVYKSEKKTITEACPGYYHYIATEVDGSLIFSCDKCGRDQALPAEYGTGYVSKCPNSSWTHTVTVQVFDHYDPGCGKTTSTFENYSISIE